MKRKMFSIVAIAALALVSCKKEELNSTELGSATINGNIWADLDQTDSDVEGVNGMTVKVEVNTQDWDQQPVGGYNYDKKVYTTTTDANGDYTLTIPATDEGYTITIEFEDVYTTATTQQGTNDVIVTRGNLNQFIYSGANITRKDQATVDVWSPNSNAYGSATVTGTVYVWMDNAGWNGFDGYVPFDAGTGLTNQDVQWVYDNGNQPYNNGDENVYGMTINSTDGTYTLTIPTEGLGQNDIYAYWGVIDFLGDGVINNAAATADSTVSGYYSTGSGIYYDDDWLQDGQIYVSDIYIDFNQF